MCTTEALRETEEFFHQQIPITRVMALYIEACDGVQLVLTVPFKASSRITAPLFELSSFDPVADPACPRPRPSPSRRACPPYLLVFARGRLTIS